MGPLGVDGSEGAALFEMFIEERAALLRWAVSFTARRQLGFAAEDLLAEALLRMVEQRVELRSPNRAAFRAYAIRCMKNLAATQGKRASRWQSELAHGELDLCSRDHGEASRGEPVEIDRLAVKDAQVVALRGVLGLSFGEIAGVLGAKSADAVRVQHGRALVRLSVQRG